MIELVVVAALASLGPTLAGYAAYCQARGANQAVNHQGADEPSLVKKVDHIGAEVKEIRGDLTLLNRAVSEGVARIVTVESAVAHISEQATSAAALAADVKADLDLSHERADAVPATAHPGVAADAAVQTTTD